MDARYVQRGDAIDHTPAADVAAGDVVVIGKIVGVAKLDIKAGELGALALTGVYEVAKGTGIAFCAVRDFVKGARVPSYKTISRIRYFVRRYQPVRKQK